MLRTEGPRRVPSLWGLGVATLVAAVEKLCRGHLVEGSSRIFANSCSRVALGTRARLLPRAQVSCLQGKGQRVDPQDPLHFWPVRGEGNPGRSQVLPGLQRPEEDRAGDQLVPQQQSPSAGRPGFQVSRCSSTHHAHVCRHAHTHMRSLLGNFPDKPGSPRVSAPGCPARDSPALLRGI